MGSRDERTCLIRLLSWPASLLILALLGPVAGAEAASGCSDAVVDLRWDGRQARFTVEIADDLAERARGLMFREKMPAASGMLFVYDRPQAASFWMKNTLIPLDIIFVGADGTVTRVARMAKPHDETPIPGGSAIQFVLEINGGLAADLGLGAGAVLRHPAIDQSVAKWGCEAP